MKRLRNMRQYYPHQLAYNVTTRKKERDKGTTHTKKNQRNNG